MAVAVSASASTESLKDGYHLKSEPTFESPLRAAAFALLSNTAVQSRPRCVELVAVGADWTSNEHVLGYPDGIDPGRYVRTKALDLIFNAAASPDIPHFLILDEMNLSHVERYFADLLSAIESGEALHLHGDESAVDGTAARGGSCDRRMNESEIVNC